MSQLRTMDPLAETTRADLSPGPREAIAPRPALHAADPRSQFFHGYLKKVLRPVSRSLWRLTVEGHENIPAEGPAILASNHLSLLDSVLVAAALNRQVTFLARSEAFTMPGLRGTVRRTVLAATGQLCVDRNNSRHASTALRAGTDALRRGELLGIFPEGTRSPDGRLYRGKPGVARLAMATGAPVIPVGVIGTFQVLPLDRRVPRSGQVRLRFGTPMTFPAMDEASTDPAGTIPAGGRGQAAERALRQAQQEATDQVMAAIAGLSGQSRTELDAGFFKASLGIADRLAAGGRATI